MTGRGRTYKGDADLQTEAEEVVEMRLAAGLSQAQAASLVCVSTSVWRGWEIGRARPHMGLLKCFLLASGLKPGRRFAVAAERAAAKQRRRNEVQAAYHWATVGVYLARIRDAEIVPVYRRAFVAAYRQVLKARDADMPRKPVLRDANAAGDAAGRSAVGLPAVSLESAGSPRKGDGAG